jgi:hypothetical protein
MPFAGIWKCAKKEMAIALKKTIDFLPSIAYIGSLLSVVHCRIVAVSCLSESTKNKLKPQT